MGGLLHYKNFNYYFENLGAASSLKLKRIGYPYTCPPKC